MMSEASLTLTATPARLLYSQCEACQLLRVSRPILVGEIEAGRLRYVLIGKRRKFKLDDLTRYIDLQARGCDQSEGSLPGGKGRRTGTKTSPCKVLDFEEALAQTTRKQRK
jgi:excisionase family DNA binding protein